MNDPEKPRARFGHMPKAKTPSAMIVRFPHGFVPEKQPDVLRAPDALKIVRVLAGDTNNIVVVRHGKMRQRQRQITRPQIERCVQKGTITEGPFVNMHGHWQVNLTRYAAGEEITCSVAIEWISRLIVITTF